MHQDIWKKSKLNETMKTIRRLTIVILFASLGLHGLSLSATADDGKHADAEGKTLRLWYDEPAPDSDAGWVNRSIPMGNGYMGVNVFGGIETERIQITENSLYDWAAKNTGFKRRGVNNFAEVYLDFGHKNVSSYERELNLNDGLAHVSYQHDGVKYSRECFTSYPDKVMAIRLNASKEGALSFTLRPTIPFLGDGKSGSVSAKGDTVTLSGVMTYFDIKFEGQFKVIPTGGEMNASNGEGTITVSGADSAVILIAVGTNYQFDPQVFLTREPADKLKGFPDPHDKVTGYLTDAAAKSYEQLLANHQADYTKLFDRVNLDLGADEPVIPTDEVVDAYPDGSSSRYLEELAFQFGRYMLICSSRAGTLPPHLQGIWNVYARPPWSSQYLHDTNVQMAYAPVFSANMPELFESYAGFFNVFVHRQREYATQYLEQYNPAQLDPSGDNGWSGPFWVNPYDVPGKTPIAGFGTGCWISQMFWDYYDYTRDETLLAETVYPVMYEQANFVSRFVQEIDGALLAKPSSSPEQYLEGRRERETIGTTFDQQMFYENHHNTLTAAKILGRTDDRLKLYEKQLPLLDPIHVGKSGQIKEFREEEFYGDAGKSIDPHHRHTSMLLGSYPGQLINDSTPAWLDAVKTTLTLRTRSSNIGWCGPSGSPFGLVFTMATKPISFIAICSRTTTCTICSTTTAADHSFRPTRTTVPPRELRNCCCRARITSWPRCPHCPQPGPSGSYRGLLARGNFEVSAQWSGGQATYLEVLSKVGGTLNLRYPNVAKSVIKTTDGKNVNFVAKGSDEVSIETTKGETYVVTNIPAYVPVTAPSNLKLSNDDKSDQIKLSWTGVPDAMSYNLYRAVGSAPDYELVASAIDGTSFVYQSHDLKQIEQMTWKVTAVRNDERESDDGATVIWLNPSTHEPIK